MHQVLLCRRSASPSGADVRAEDGELPAVINGSAEKARERSKSRDRVRTASRERRRSPSRERRKSPHVSSRALSKERGRSRSRERRRSKSREKRSRSRDGQRGKSADRANGASTLANGTSKQLDAQAAPIESKKAEVHPLPAAEYFMAMQEAVLPFANPDLPRLQVTVPLLAAASITRGVYEEEEGRGGSPHKGNSTFF